MLVQDYFGLLKNQQNRSPTNSTLEKKWIGVETEAETFFSLWRRTEKKSSADIFGGLGSQIPIAFLSAAAAAAEQTTEVNFHLLWGQFLWKEESEGLKSS